MQDRCATFCLNNLCPRHCFRNILCLCSGNLFTDRSGGTKFTQTSTESGCVFYMFQALAVGKC